MDVLLFSGHAAAGGSSGSSGSIQARTLGPPGRRVRPDRAGARRSRSAPSKSYPVEVQVDGDCVLETPIVCRTASGTRSDPGAGAAVKPLLTGGYRPVSYFFPTAFSTSAISFGAPQERQSDPVAVTATVSSIRTPMFHHFGSTPGMFAGM